MTKQLRFEVFKRDSFTCQYCGQTPPDAILEVDHIQPRSEGGSEDINNLTTACFSCNRGKGATPLITIPGKISENIEIIKEREAQWQSYQRFIKNIGRREIREVAAVESAFQKLFPTQEFSESFRRVSVKQFIRRLPLPIVLESLHIAYDHFPRSVSSRKDATRVLSYFCGVCWRKIKGDGRYAN